MRLVGRRQAIIAAILRLTISEQGWECQVYRRYGMSLDRIVSHVCCVMYITLLLTSEGVAREYYCVRWSAPPLPQTSQRARPPLAGLAPRAH